MWGVSSISCYSPLRWSITVLEEHPVEINRENPKYITLLQGQWQWRRLRAQALEAAEADEVSAFVCMCSTECLQGAGVISSELATMGESYCT